LSMWGAADDDMYFASGAEIKHWNGTAMATIFTSPSGISVDRVSGVRANGADEIFATGRALTDDRSGYIALGYRYDGTTWTKTELDQAPLADHRYFSRVWANAPGEAIAVGYGGIAYRYAGGSWQRITTGVTTDLMGVWGPDADHAWISGANQRDAS